MTNTDYKSCSEKKYYIYDSHVILNNDLFLCWTVIELLGFWSDNLGRPELSSEHLHGDVYEKVFPRICTLSFCRQNAVRCGLVKQNEPDFQFCSGFVKPEGKHKQSDYQQWHPPV